jgi:hypothetical protein
MERSEKQDPEAELPEPDVLPDMTCTDQKGGEKDDLENAHFIDVDFRDQRVSADHRLLLRLWGLSRWRCDCCETLDWCFNLAMQCLLIGLLVLFRRPAQHSHPQCHH